MAKKRTSHRQSEIVQHSRADVPPCPFHDIDYLSKPFNPRELVARIRAVLRRTARDTERRNQVITVGLLHLDPATLNVVFDGEPVRLTGTEFRVLELLMRGVGEVQSRDLLTERVLGRRLSSYDRSIDTHISNLRRGSGGRG